MNEPGFAPGGRANTALRTCVVNWFIMSNFESFSLIGMKPVRGSLWCTMRVGRLYRGTLRLAMTFWCGTAADSAVAGGIGRGESAGLARRGLGERLVDPSGDVCTTAQKQVDSACGRC